MGDDVISRVEAVLRVARYLRRCCEQTKSRNEFVRIPAGALLDAADTLDRLSPNLEGEK